MQSFVPQVEIYTSCIINFTNPLHAFFESMRGLTMSIHDPSDGKGVLFNRSNHSGLVAQVLS